MRRTLRAWLRTGFCGLAAAAALLSAGTLAPAEAAPSAVAAKQCSVANVKMNVSYYGAAYGFHASCTQSHWLEAAIWFYNSSGLPLASGSGYNKVDPGGWKWVTGTHTNSSWMPIAKACIWIYQDNEWGPQLYYGCFPRNQ